MAVPTSRQTKFKFGAGELLAMEPEPNQNIAGAAIPVTTPEANARRCVAFGCSFDIVIPRRQRIYTLRGQEWDTVEFLEVEVHERGRAIAC